MYNTSGLSDSLTARLFILSRMEFLNDQVHLDNLPLAADAALQPINRLYGKVLRWAWTITMGILLIILCVLFYFIPALHQPLWLMLGGAFWLLLGLTWFTLQEMSFRNKAYAVRDHDIIYRTGWIIQHTHTCPFNRVQHSTVSAGPFERKYGLATLGLYTAASDNADLQIPGLEEAAAWALKEWITKKITDEPDPEQ